MTFQANRAYDKSLDVRNAKPLSERIQQEPAEGAIWLLVAPRRGRKTWTLRGLESSLGKGRSKYIDLRSGSLPNETPKRGYYFLLDEPLPLLSDAGKALQFIQICADLQRQNARVVLALTPAECELILRHGNSSALVSDKAIVPIPPLSVEEAAKLAERSTDAVTLLSELPPLWGRNAFLLEMLFELQEQNPSLRMLALLRAALTRCESTGTEYFKYVFQEGLSAEQRQVVRDIAAGKNPAHGRSSLLRMTSLVETDPQGHHRIADPILSVYFSALRIHHLSDVHVGPKAAETIDAKDVGKLSIAADHGKVREAYVQHLKQLKARGQAPHIVVVSGDLTEYATADQLAEGRAWLGRVRAELADDPLLDPDSPRVLLVGGNHDVDWAQTRGTGAAARHQPFAEAFADFQHPQLQLPPESRPAVVVAYPDFGTEFLLLGSAELGGEVEEDLERARLQLELAALAHPLSPTERAAAEETALKAARIDPGLVHAKALERANAHTFGESVRIAVLHHPVSPLPTITEIARYAGLLNAGAVKDFLFGRRFCLVLHGHTHSAWFCVEQWPGLHDGWKLRIASAPSLSSREVTERHGYNAIEIARDYDGQGARHHRITVRRYTRQGQHNWQAGVELPAFLPGE